MESSPKKTKLCKKDSRTNCYYINDTNGRSAAEEITVPKSTRGESIRSEARAEDRPGSNCNRP